MSEVGTVITAQDAKFHLPFPNEPMWCETNWYSFTIPELPLRGHIYNVFRPNARIARSMVYVYSKMNKSWTAFDYWREDMHLPMPHSNLDDYRLENGVRIRMKQPFEKWLVQFDDKRGNVWDLEAEALMPPVSHEELKIADAGPGYTVFHKESSPGPLQTGHLDQTLLMRGEVVINGKRHAVEFPANHDHSWSPRREFGHNVMGNYDELHFGSDMTIQVQSRNDEVDRGTVTHGYVREGREVFPLKAGEVRIELVDRWVPREVHYEVEDVRGKSWHVVGTPIALAETVGVNAFSMGALLDLRLGSERGTGEYKWHWDVQLMQKAIREGQFGWSLD